MATDRLMFSVDWPFGSDRAGTGRMKSTNLRPQDKAKGARRDSKDLLKLRVITKR
jgi:hypothetical protein